MNMNQSQQNAAASVEDIDNIDDLRPRLDGTNINKKTLLAPDYINHFSAIVMVIDLIPELKSNLAEARRWRPKSYVAHFENSGFAARDLAIHAYRLAPIPIRARFDETIDRLNLLVAVSLDRIEKAVMTGDREIIRAVTMRASRDLQHMIDVVGAIIDGADTRIAQDDIDTMFEDR